MLAAAELGAIIHPPVPAFYTHPKTIDDIVDQTIGRALDSFGLEMPNLRRWPQDIHPGCGGDAAQADDLDPDEPEKP